MDKPEKINLFFLIFLYSRSIFFSFIFYIMVPHAARRLSEDLDILGLLDEAKDQGYKEEASGSSNRLFGEELDIKPEIDTGQVSESCFSFKKLWKYMGPGKET